MTNSTTVDPKATTRDRVLGLCAPGLVGWVLVGGLFAVFYVDMPDNIRMTLLAILNFPLFIPFPGATVSVVVCFTTGVGLLALLKATSARTRWIVGLTYLVPVVALIAWWWMLADGKI